MKKTLTLTVLTLMLNTVALNTDRVFAETSKNSSGESRHTQNQPLSKTQSVILDLAYSVAVEDGHANPKVLQGIIMQESKGGTAKNFRTAKHKKSSDQTVGIGQIKVGTALAVLQAFPEMKQQYKVSAGNISQALAFNDRFNIAIASKYLKMMYKINGTDAFAIAAYNKGPGGAQRIKNYNSLHYVRAVKAHIQHL